MGWLNVEISDVQNRYHRTIPRSREPYVGTLLTDAEDELLVQIPDLPTRVVNIADGQVAPTGMVPRERVVRIVCDTVIAVLRNPDGYVTEASARGPFSTSGTRAAGAVRTKVAFDEADLRKLRAPKGHAPARTIGLHVPTWRRP
ncbi:hypothetical protein WY02_03555 [Pseudonocardia sp. AL041005-10]|nr:hypothetical protein [Pseudonocardia sp. AL041005-10]ALE77678.1 hypothetical protein WY02_03555 [Pseudonocardia sp. AL041005-10]